MGPGATAPVRRLANLRELIDDPVFRISLRNSLLYAPTAVPLRLVGALGLALVLHRRGRLRAAGRVAVLIPTVIPDAAYALLWLWILNPVRAAQPRSGGCRSADTGVAHPGDARPMGRRDHGRCSSSARGVLIALVARRQVPEELHEIAAINGAGRVEPVRPGHPPVMAPALLLIVARDTILSLQATFAPALIVTEGGPPPYATTYLPLFVYRNAFEYLRYGYASAATAVMLDRSPPRSCGCSTAPSCGGAVGSPHQ